MSVLRETRTLAGLGVSPGIAIGRAVCIDCRALEVYRFPLAESRTADEVERLREAVRQAARELSRIRAGRTDDGGLADEIKSILEAHLLLLHDDAFLDRIELKIRDEHVNAEWAVHRVVLELVEQFETIEDDYLRGRSQDLRDVASYVQRALAGVSHHELSEIDGDVILIAEDLPPADAVRLGRERIAGFAVGSGGRTSHTTIIARSLKVPLVGGIAGVTGMVTDEDPVIVDGEAGLLILHPTPETLERYRSLQRVLAEEEVGLRATRRLPAITRDGVLVTLGANIDLPEEIDDAVAYGAQGIGLYRSEFLYIEKSPRLPTVEEHEAIYRRLAEGVAPAPVVVRTYDLGGRKLARELMNTKEENPVLGLRGIRLTMARPEIFRVQLKGIFRAAADHDIRPMLPLVSTVEEVRGFRAFAATVLDELEAEGVPYCRDYRLGVMIEVPAAALAADLLAREVDFFSIGTNDLIQYSLAVDRNNEHVSGLYQPLHPSVLRLLRFVIESAAQAGIEVSLCGEMAADARLVPLLLGLGLRRLSLSPRLVPAVKARVRALAMADLATMAEGCRGFATAAEVGAFLDQFLERSLGTGSRPAAGARGSNDEAFTMPRKEPR